MYKRAVWAVFKITLGEHKFWLNIIRGYHLDVSMLKIRLLTFLCAITVGIFFLMPAAQAEALSDFKDRINAAYKAPNPRAALWDLFYTPTLDQDAYAILLETVEKLYLLRPPLTILPEPLHANEELVERADGYIYFQNLEPLGAINIIESRNKTRLVRQYYSRREGTYYLTATIRQKEVVASQPVPKDNWFSRRDRGQKKRTAPVITTPPLVE
jgi:hypothetical protein